ncbi:MAG: NPCBM/NEW2 domain-containing protein [Planctomycetaceae bacterium]|nr:NPCBM/NEW2 domain-containing protein [Planctomycetaceae bacterium]
MYWVTIIIAGLWAADAPSHRVDTIEATSIRGTIAAVTADQVELQTKEGKQSIPRGEVARLTLAAPGDAQTRLSQAMVMTLDGAELAAQSVSLDQGKLAVSLAGVSSLEIPIAQVKAIYLPDAKSCVEDIRAKCDELKIAASTQDVLVAVKKDGAYVSVQGAVKAIDAGGVTFNWKESDRRSARDTVRAVLLGQTAPPAAAPRGGMLVMCNGSRLPWASLTLDDKAFHVETSLAKALTLDRGLVASVSFNSDKVTDLAELVPDAVEQHGLLGEGFKYRRGQSVSGTPLCMNKQTYSSGLGLHSYTSLSYNIDGKYARLAALAGIDDAAAAGGDALLVVLGDDKPLIQPMRLRRGQPPQVVHAQLKDVKRLMIRVEFGPDKLDVGDHVDLVAARLIR